VVKEVQQECTESGAMRAAEVENSDDGARTRFGSASPAGVGSCPVIVELSPAAVVTTL
jgi:hypothetical protein